MAAVLTEMRRKMEAIEESLAKKSDPYVRTMNMRRIERGLASLCEDEVHQFITACVQRRCFHCAVAAAVHTKILYMILGQLPDLGIRFWNEWAAVLIIRQLWTPVETILRHFFWYGFSEQISTLAFKFADDKGLGVFAMLQWRCSEGDLDMLTHVVTHVFNKAYREKLTILTYSDNTTVRTAVYYYSAMTGFLPLFMKTDRLKNVSLRKQFLRNNCLATAYEAGLFTILATSAIAKETRRKVATFAVNNLLLDAVHFLYEAGVMNSHLLFQLSHDRKLLDKLEKVPESGGSAPVHDVDVYSARKIRNFLSYNASHPRCLMVLCLMEVSVHLSWGHHRRGKVDELEVPPVAKDWLMLKGSRRLLKP